MTMFTLPAFEVCVSGDHVFAVNDDEGGGLYSVDYDGDVGREADYEVCNIGPHKDSLVCRDCEESDYPSTLVRFGPEGKEAVKFTDDRAYDAEFYEEPPPWFWEVFPGSRGYHRTDGWRGYYDTKLKGLRSITEGWVTGYPDDTVARKLDAAELYEMLNDGETTPPAPLFWLFEPTSNVFSTASEMLVAPEDYDAVTSWLADIGFPVEKLERAFG